jgi:UrcA family protein
MSGVSKFALISAALAAGLLVAGAASAQSDEAVTIHVRANDLNLQTEAGARTMMNRIHSAAAAACGTPASNVDGDYDKCVSDAVSGAAAQTKSPMVMAMSQGKTGTALAQAGQPTYRGYTAGEPTRTHHRARHHHRVVHHHTHKSATAETH